MIALVTTTNMRKENQNSVWSISNVAAKRDAVGLARRVARDRLPWMNSVIRTISKVYNAREIAHVKLAHLTRVGILAARLLCEHACGVTHACWHPEAQLY